MATSKPEFQGFVLQNGGSYCGMYKRKVMNVSNTVSTQYYWLPTNKSGDITDFRVNMLNGTFADASTANSNYPSGYSLYADNWPNEKYLSLMPSYPHENVQLWKDSINDWCSTFPEVNNIVVPIFWNNVFESYDSTGKRQDQNYGASWSAVDELIIFAKSKGRKVSLFINLFMSGVGAYAKVDDFWGLSNNEKDEWGNPIAVGNYGDGHPSLADSSSGSGMNMMKDFYEKVVQRYGGTTGYDYSLGTQLNWVSFSITAQMEYGYNYDNRYTYANDFKALSGYSTATIAGFRTWLDNPARYANIGALNTAWGSSFANFAAVMPPTTGKSVASATMADFAALFYTKKGKDWWQYLAQTLYDFADALRTIMTSATATYAPQAKYVLSFGGNSPNDELCILRCTYDVVKWSDLCDGMKTAYWADLNRPETYMSIDYLQNYTGKIMNELHHIDYWGDQNNPLPANIVKPLMIASGTTSIQNGVKDIMFISTKLHPAEYYNMMKEVFAELRLEMKKDNENARVVVGSATVTLGELLNSGGSIAVSKWQVAGGSATKRIDLTFSNSIPALDSNFPFSYSLFDNQTYYLKQSDIKHSVYGRLADYDNPSPAYNTLQQDYNTNRVPFLLSAFGITYPGGTKTRSTIEIIDNNGVVWVKCVQSAGATNTEQSGKYANNHPEFRYDTLRQLQEDCRFWLPIPASGGYYDIKITVQDAACRFDVYHADIGAPGGIAYNEGKATTSAGSTETIRVSLSQMGQSNINQRVIKINNNKWA